MNRCKNQIEKLLQILNNTKVKETKISSNTPNNKMSTRIKTNQITQKRKSLSGNEYTPSGKSRLNKLNLIKSHKDQYNTLANSFVHESSIVKTNKPNITKYVKEDQCKKSSNSRNIVITVSKTVKSKVYPLVGGKNERKNWKEHIEDHKDICSMTTNKSSGLPGKATVREEDECSSDDRLTVIEHDCDNNYDLICNSLEGYKF